MAWEFNLLDQIQQHLANDFFDILIPRISSLGDAGLIWIALSVLLLLFPKTRKAGLASGIALIFMLINFQARIFWMPLPKFTVTV